LGARFLERPYRALANMPGADRGALPLLRIGLEQVVNICLVGALADDADRLRQAAPEHIAAKPLSRHELGRSLAHRMQPLQPEAKRGGGLCSGGLPLFALLCRKKEFRFEESEPRRHDEIICRDLKP